MKEELKEDAEDESEGVMDDSIHAERVEDEKEENKKYLKTNRVSCQALVAWPFTRSGCYIVRNLLCTKKISQS